MGVENDFELRIVEAPEGLPEPEIAPRELPSARRDLTPYEVLDVLRATKGAASVIEQIPAIERPDLWGEVASFSACGISGTAFDGVFLWDCDHVGNDGSMHNNLLNCYAVFTDKAPAFLARGSQGTLTGSVSCFFTAPNAGKFVFHVQLQTFINPDSPSSVRPFISGFVFPDITFSGPVDVPLVALLGAGFHHFRIHQVSGSFIFQRLRQRFAPSGQYGRLHGHVYHG
jgi:hypothetical protein